jgi:hypothetical protein
MTRRYGNGLDERLPRNLSGSQIEERMAQNVRLLFEAYKIQYRDPGCWLRLAFGLARDHVPGFSESQKGAPDKWDFGRHMRLFEAVEQEIAAGHSTSGACALLAAKPPFNQWGPRGRRPSAETMREAYYAAKKDHAFLNLMLFA